MTGKRIIFYILAAFITATLFLIYIQYNSAKSISSLINGNEKFLSEYKVNFELKELEKDVLTIESNVRGAVATNDRLQVQKLETAMAEVQHDLLQLQKISDDNITVKQVDELDSLVQAKLQFNKEVLNLFVLKGKTSAEELIATERGIKLTDSITLAVQNIENTRHAILAKIAVSTDKSGQKAQRFNTILIAVVLICGAGLFWYIINTIRRQLSLIQQLNTSEKKVKEAAQIKENFMANMSHEIRTPMNAILGFTNLLQRQQLDAESKEYVQTIQNSGESLLTIINDILDLSKIEAGMVRIETAPFSIRGLIHSIETMLKPKATEKRLAFLVNVDEDVPDTLEGDATRLTQILINLIGNALKFTGNGGVSIAISNEGISDEVIKTGITVSDTGIGVAKEKLPFIFERFQQAEDSVTRRYGGTGLGLSIVRDLVLLQQGTIDVKSKPGAGTTFKLILPYKISPDKFVVHIAADNSMDLQSGFGQGCILVVEDNEINQRLLRHLFNHWQLDFDIATNGREAIKKLQVKKYALILMDIQMPEMDGYSTTREIRVKLALPIPIIAMTAHALAGEREKCLSYGMNDYISKPIREKELHSLIAQFIPVNTLKGSPNKQIAGVDSSPYTYINLQYMKEVSNGNVDYEKSVTEQFIEAIPADLAELEKAWHQNDIVRLRQLAHNMKTTVSVMGLTEMLQLHLDALEYENLNARDFAKHLARLKSVAHASVKEATQFLATF